MKQMKDSGIEWIGEIPDNWELIKIGSIFRCRNEKVNDTDYPPLSVTRNGIVPQRENVAKTDANDNRKMVKVNDFVINSRSDRKQSCGVSGLDGSVSLINTVLYTENSDVILPEYTNLLMKNYGFAEEFYRWGHGIVADLWTTRWQEMKSIVLPLPCVQQQKRIIKFVQKKIFGIDNLLLHEQATIEELKAYKQSVITEAVTKGLDKSVPMKDSGVEWIGKIPESWSISKIKMLADETQENAFIDGDWIESPYIEDTGIRYLTTGNIGDGVFKRQGNGFISDETFTKLQCKYAYPQDLIFSRLNEEYGRSCILPNDYDKYVIAVDNVILRTNEDKKYICYVTQCSNYHKAVFFYARGTAMKRISRTNLGNVAIPLPSIAEQQQIADYLDKKCADIDSLIYIKQQKIEELKEYKKSLIYEYVTGKKEVA